MNYDKSVLLVVGKRIQQLRQQKGFTQQQFSEMVGISTNYLSDLERGVSSPRMDKLVAIINALGCSADEVFADVLENGYQVRASSQTDELAKLPPREQERAFAILEAPIELLNEKPLSSISVSEITEKAGVSRMTYYRNFESKEEILEKYIGSIFENYHREVYAHAKRASYIRYENVLLGFEYFRRYEDLARCLMSNNLGWYIRDAVIRSELSLSLVSENDKESRYVFIAYANTLFGIMTEWVISGMKDDPQKLAKLICDLYQDKIRRY